MKICFVWVYFFLRFIYYFLDRDINTQFRQGSLLCNCSGSSFVVHNQLLAFKRSRSTAEHGEMVFVGIQFFDGNSFGWNHYGRCQLPSSAIFFIFYGSGWNQCGCCNPTFWLYDTILWRYIFFIHSQDRFLIPSKGPMIRIPTVKLQIPEKAFLKSESRTSATFKF